MTRSSSSATAFVGYARPRGNSPTSQHVGMQCLTDYAAAAVIVHTHAGAYLTRGVSGDVADLPAHSMARRAHLGRAAWSLGPPRGAAASHGDPWVGSGTR